MTRKVPVGSVIWFPQVPLAALLLWALYPDNPYFYYIFLRWAVLMSAFLVLPQFLDSEDVHPGWTIGYVAVVLLYNPIVPVHLNREIWSVLNVITAIYVLMTCTQTRVVGNDVPRQSEGSQQAAMRRSEDLTTKDRYSVDKVEGGPPSSCDEDLDLYSDQPGVDNGESASDDLRDSKRVVTTEVKADSRLEGLARDLHELQQDQGEIDILTEWDFMPERFGCYLPESDLCISVSKRIRTDCEPFFALSQEIIDAGSDVKRDMHLIFERWDGVRVDADTSFSSVYSGNSHGGWHDISVESAKGEIIESPFFEHMDFEKTPFGLLASFYVTHILKTMGTYWHGAYDRDYVVAIDLSAYLKLLGGVRTANKQYWDALSKDLPGIQFEIADGEWIVSALAVYPNGTVVKLTTMLDNGRVCVVDETIISESPVRVLY